MEKLLHYIWKHKLFALQQLITTKGQMVEVLDPGLYNTNAGPDFFNAKIKIGQTEWIGNVEIHIKSSEWFAHNHHKDPNYNNVILHVCSVIDDRAVTNSGLEINQMQIDVPKVLKNNYEELIASISQIPSCYSYAAQMSEIKIHDWLYALDVERLERKTKDIEERFKRCNSSWDDTYFVTLARNFGFGVNSDVFEEWAYNVPLNCVGHHRDDILQVEAIFMGQAGLLNVDEMKDKDRAKVASDSYFWNLQKEYNYLAHKFSLKPLSRSVWKFLRLRPQNFPYIRIAQLANLYFQHKTKLRDVIECSTIKDLEKLFKVSVTPYWEQHFSFGAKSAKSYRMLTHNSINLILINTVVPIIFAYGKYKDDDALCEKAFNLWQQLKAENNHITKKWKDAGLAIETAADSQALVQLYNEYCNKNDCLKCRFGYNYLQFKQNKKE